jgi:flagellar L-ring protein precursor FlgH
MEMKMRLRSSLPLAWTLAALFSLLAAGAGAEGLYQEGQFRALTSDNRAYRPGDVLTVLVVENASASASANTTTEKRGGIGAALVAAPIMPNRGVTLDLNDDFSGKGTINRTGRLLAQISVTVRTWAPNGDLIVAGQQLIEVNGEKQNIILEGQVRRVDISESNTVLSTRIADAKITYVGDGILGEKQSAGVLTRILSWLGIL